MTKQQRDKGVQDEGIIVMMDYRICVGLGGKWGYAEGEGLGKWEDWWIVDP